MSMSFYGGFRLSAAIGDHDLATLLHVIQSIGEILAGFSDTCRAHIRIVSHVALRMRFACRCLAVASVDRVEIFCRRFSRVDCQCVTADLGRLQ
jgi:hypothetical protein